MGFEEPIKWLDDGNRSCNTILLCTNFIK